MSRLTVSNIEGKLKNGVKTIEVENGSYIKQPNGVVQTITHRTDERASFSVPSSGNGTTISPLSASITPVFADSLLLITIMVNCETLHNSVFLIHTDGVLIEDAGYESYNSISGNARYSGIAAPYLDRNESSTPTNYFIQYAVPANDTTTRSYALAIRASSTASYMLYLNRTYDSLGGEYRETGISNITIMEIAS